MEAVRGADLVTARWLRADILRGRATPPRPRHCACRPVRVLMSESGGQTPASSRSSRSETASSGPIAEPASLQVQHWFRERSRTPTVPSNLA